MNALVISAPLAPLFGALLAALGGTRLGNKGAHRATILSVLWAFVAVIIAAKLSAGVLLLILTGMCGCVLAMLLWARGFWWIILRR